MASIWETTSVPNLLRHKAKGRYYVRFAVNGKRKMASLKTDKISIAKVRVHKKLAEVQAQRMSGIPTQAGSAKNEPTSQP